MPDDLQLAQKVMERQLGEDYRYFRSYWHHYQGGVWIRQDDIYDKIKPTLIEARKTEVKVSKARFASVEFFLQMELMVRHQQTTIDNVGNYLNFTNGMLNLNTMQLEEHRRDTFLTTQLDFDYIDDTYCPVFQDFIQDVLVKPDSTDPDWDMIKLMQEVIGYTLSADRTRRISVWLLGDSNTGKSTLVNALISVLKPLQITIDLNKLGGNDYLLAELPGKRLVTCTEADVGVKLNVGVYKTLVSSDELVADIKYRDPIRFVPSCVVWWAMNHTPYISDRTDATFNRVIMFPFNRVIPSEKRDYHLMEKLFAERAQIVRWALDGYERYRRQGGFTVSEQVNARLAEFREEIDIYQAFLKDEDYVTRSGKTKPLELYSTFRIWCDQRGIKSIPTMHQIAKEWRRCGLELVLSSGRWWNGVSINYKVHNT
ncbi:MAG: hypothetical protein KJ065_26895 [Anaerolineae bacterium]|nr:hypothetical protein [Anaerolineae bacterium]